LSIATPFPRFNPDINQYINADRWQQLISAHLLNLRIFDLQHASRELDPCNKHQPFETLVDKFNSEFWIEHQWFFNWHYHQLTWSDATIFYSISETNMITKVTINKEITLEKIQLLTAIFRRMDNLTINLFKQDLEPIAHFLL
ncbi:unnamed protein product, partial [Adineta steineri]